VMGLFEALFVRGGAVARRNESMSVMVRDDEVFEVSCLMLGGGAIRCQNSLISFLILVSGFLDSSR